MKRRGMRPDTSMAWTTPWYKSEPSALTNWLKDFHGPVKLNGYLLLPQQREEFVVVATWKVVPAAKAIVTPLCNHSVISMS